VREELRKKKGGEKECEVCGLKVNKAVVFRNIAQLLWRRVL
jgi:hypothetical protein